MRIKIILLISVLALSVLPLFAAEPNLPTPLSGANVSSDFGPRNVTTGSYFHKGIDWGADLGTQITSIESGIIFNIVYEKKGYGWNIRVKKLQSDTTNKADNWWYCHMFSNNDDSSYHKPSVWNNWTVAKAVYDSGSTRKYDTAYVHSGC